MKLYEDRALIDAAAKQHLISPLDESRIRGCAVDLSIGRIYVPGASKDALGSVQKPYEGELALKQGQTAVIQTMEELKLSAKQAGFAFPAARVSLKGLLMTNPGHIDPGYEGQLHVTVINFAKEPYLLRRGERLLRALIVELDRDAEKPYKGRIPNPIDDELLNRLSHDFLDVDARTQAAASRAISKAELRVKVGTM